MSHDNAAMNTGEETPEMLAQAEMREWAVSYAMGALRLHKSVPEIEQALMHKGLAAPQATAIVDHCWLLRLTEDARPARRAEFWTRVSQAASLVVAACYLGGFFFFAGWRGVLIGLARLLMPMGCIFLPQVLGNFTGYIRDFRYISRPTPAIMIAIAGWILLIANVVLLIVMITYGNKQRQV